MKLIAEEKYFSILVNRYFVKSKKQILHYGDCNIYAADKPFCSCGLLHWLRYMDYTLVGIIYPRFENDCWLEATGRKRRRQTKKQREEQKSALEILESVFGPLNKERPSLEEIKMDYDDINKILKFFKKKDFPGGFRRLKRWLEQLVSRDYN